jgi:hypothetical protein
MRLLFDDPFQLPSAALEAGDTDAVNRKDEA